MDCEKSYFQLFSLDAALGYTIMGCLSTTRPSSYYGPSENS